MSILKIKLLKAPIVYYDIFQLDDLIINISSIGTQAIFILIISFILLILLLYKSIKNQNKQKYRGMTFVIILCIFLFCFYTVDPVKNYLKKHNIKHKWNSDIYVKSQKNGLITFFIQSIYFSNHLQKPENYSLELAKEFLDDYEKHNNSKNNISKTVKPDNIIILLIESFQDVQKLPWKSNVEITPAYNKMKASGYSGELISPVFGGKSVNSEFELLTSFSSVFTPYGSIPYKDIVKQNLPSIARQLSSYDYVSNVIQVVEMKGYGYKSIYNYLGFDNKFSLSKHDKDIDLDPTGRFGSSSAISKQIIKLIEDQEKSFIFAFPNSSHSPWLLSDYPENKILLDKSTLKIDEKNEIIAYYNALSHVDKLISDLYNYSIESNEKTVILIIGDHQPSLKASYNNSINSSPLMQKVQNHLVPYLFWSNYNLKYPVTNEQFTSMNLISTKLLKILDLKATGFYKFIQEINETYNAFSFVLLRNNKIIDTYSQWSNKIVNQYNMIQYMYLSGDFKP
jgi:phosphoglycerol transferase MdoB-like AlkP superfamily enzyme